VSLPAVEALGRLLRMGRTVITTGDAALHLRITRSAATRALGRLSAAGLVLPVRHGLAPTRTSTRCWPSTSRRTLVRLALTAPACTA
jgi:hypothetical protein